MIQFSTMRIRGAPPPGTNPLPYFRTWPRTGRVNTLDTLTPGDHTLLGYETAPRYLPYLVRDRYERARDEVLLKVVTLENDHLKATFLPEYGGRLYSLYSKDMGRELLYRNPAIQPANMAVLDAWIAGGAEFNVGQVGHSASTSAPVFCAAVDDGQGRDFLRIYEYERMNELYWQLDFHLAPGDRELGMYARILNDRKRPANGYYWTSIAVQEESETRVFSSTGQVIYYDPDQNAYGRGELPDLPILPEGDASYPQAFQCSAAYYFQPAAHEPFYWEAACYPGNWMFYERSTAPLRYRKMACWGTHSGGMRWRDQLSEPGMGNHLGLEAGLAPTQQHGYELQPGESVEFYQCFGGLRCDTEPFYASDWNAARQGVKQALDAALAPDAPARQLVRLRQHRDNVPHDILCHGSGYGALESARRRKTEEPPPPRGMPFSVASMTEEQMPWLNLLNEGVVPPARDARTTPPSYMVQEEWRVLLEKSLSCPGGDSPAANVLLGVAYMEQNEEEKAARAFQRSLEQRTSFFMDRVQNTEVSLALRCLAQLAERRGDPWTARDLYEQALDVGTRQYKPGEICTETEDWVLPVYVEYLALLARQGDHRGVWAQYLSMPKDLRLEESVRLQVLPSALETRNIDYAKKMLEGSFTHLREYHTIPSDAWIRLHQIIVEAETGEVLDAEEVEKRYPIPYRLDYRMWRTATGPVHQ